MRGQALSVYDIVVWTKTLLNGNGNGTNNNTHGHKCLKNISCLFVYIKKPIYITKETLMRFEPQKIHLNNHLILITAVVTTGLTRYSFNAMIKKV